jgi:2-polyprenyl-3-methyl-5-hydroxy-6-metoxy-1,4-benzoquinol methylase
MFRTRLNCPACGCNKFKNIYNNLYETSPLSDYINKHFNQEGKVNWSTLHGVAYVLNECVFCEMIFQSEIPEDVLLYEIYNHWLAPREVPSNENLDDFHQWFREAWGANFEQAHLHPRYSRDSHELMMVSKLLNLEVNQLKVLDYGSGWGTWVRVAKEMGCETFGYELSQKASTFTKQFGIQMLNWDDIPQHKFDFINTEQVFEHLADPSVVLDYLAKVLKPGGLLKISVPTLSGIESKINNLNLKIIHSNKDSMFPVEPLVHINCFNMKSLRVMSENAGLNIVNIPLLKCYSFLFNLGINWFSYRQVFKSLSRPIYRRINNKNIYIFFSN